jgi:hypothetical protein
MPYRSPLGKQYDRRSRLRLLRCKKHLNLEDALSQRVYFAIDRDLRGLCRDLHCIIAVHKAALDCTRDSGAGHLLGSGRFR